MKLGKEKTIASSVNSKEVPMAGPQPVVIDICGPITSMLLLLLLPVAAIFSCVSFFADGWSVTEVQLGASYITSGLWRRCRHTSGGVTCKNLFLEQVSESFLAAQVSAIVSLLCLVLALLACGGYLRNCQTSRQILSGLVLSGFLLASGIFGGMTCFSFIMGDQIDTGLLLSPVHKASCLYYFSYALVLNGLSSLLCLSLGGVTIWNMYYSCGQENEDGI